MENSVVNIARLKAARTASGLTLERVAEAVGLGASSLSEFENGRREPRLAQLRALAELYQRTLAWFLEVGVPAEPLVLWRDQPQEREVAAGIERRFLHLCQMQRNLEKWCGVEARCSLPRAEWAPESFSDAQAEELASRVRMQLSLGDRPALTLLPALEEECGVSIFHLPFEPTGSAACSYSEETGYSILLNAGNVRWRRNFDLAHELFHLLTWGVFRKGGGKGRLTDKEERLADGFAAALLLPSDAFLRAVNGFLKDNDRLRHEDVFEIARRFDVSHAAVLWRMHKLYGRTREATTRDLEVCKRLRAALDQRPTDDKAPPERPAYFVALARKALRSGNISTGRAAEYLGVSRRSANQLAQPEEAIDDAITLGSA